MPWVLPWLAFAVAPLDLSGTATEVDLDEVRTAIEVRLGHGTDGWSVVVTDESASRVQVQLTPPTGPRFERSVVLESPDSAGRARQLAATLAILVEQHEPPLAPLDESPPPHVPIGWLGLGGRVAGNFAPDVAVDGGIGLGGGGWLVKEHVQPRGELGWSRSTAEPLTVDALRASAQLALGGQVGHGLAWIGGGVGAGLVRVVARETETDRTTVGAFAVCGIAQVRWRWLLAELDLGPEVLTSPLHFEGASASLDWNRVRFVFGIRVGYVFRK